MNDQQATLVRTAKILSLVLSGLLLALGITLIFWSVELAVTLRFVFGVLSLLVGGAKIFGYFTNDLYRIAFQFDLAVGSLVAIFGVLLLALPDTVMPYLTTMVVLYVLLDGLLRVQTAVDAYRFGMPYWYLLLALALALALGSLSVVLFGSGLPRIVWMGVMLVADSAMGAFVTMYTVRVRIKKKNYPLDEDR